jgi:hypothetical protein
VEDQGMGEKGSWHRGSGRGIAASCRLGSRLRRCGNRESFDRRAAVEIVGEDEGGGGSVEPRDSTSALQTTNAGPRRGFRRSQGPI